MSADLMALRLALRERLRAIPSYPGDEKVAWENEMFTPPAEGMYLRESLATGEERLASSGMTMTLGIYWIFVHAPIGRGIEDPEALSKEIAEAFPIVGAAPSPGLHLYRTTRQPGRVEGLAGNEGLWYTIPVLVYWRLFTAL